MENYIVQSQDLFFEPKDFDSVITYGLLESYIEEVITDIRNNDNSSQPIIEDIKILQDLEKSIDKTNIGNIFLIYQQIQKISLDLRKKLSKFIDLDVYDNIEYAFYYNGKRYYTKELKSDWLILDKKGLKIDLSKAIQDIENNISDDMHKKINDLFSYHYICYLNAITGMYKDKNHKKLGQAGARINKGHVAEAYELHLMSSVSGHRHEKIYELSKKDSLTEYEQNMVKQAYSGLQVREWTQCETADQAWIYIRAALGTQRGTVAGDVKNVQVKQTISTYYKEKERATVKLTSLYNLQQGVNNYCQIFNKEIPIQTIAEKITTYLTENLKENKDEAFTKKLADIANKDLNFKTKYNKKYQKIINI